MLLQSLKMDVIPIPYEYESTNFNTLLRLLDNALNEAHAM